MSKKIEPRDNPCYCINLRRAANTITKLYDRALEPTNLSISQYSLLNDIYFIKSCSKTELAQYTKLDRTTIIRNLKMLCEKGLIVEIPGENKRNNLIQLTSLGKTAIAEGLGAWERAQRQIKSEVGQEGLECFMKVIKIIESMI